MNGVYTFLYLAGFLVVPFALGFGISRALRVKEYAGKLGLILFTIGLACSPFVNQLAKGNPWLSALDLGIDLAGGTNLVYELAEQGSDQEALSDDLMNRMVAAVGRRINPAGTKEIVVRRVGQDRIEVIVPGTNPEEVAAVKRSMTQLGNLEFGIVARTPDHTEIITRANASPATEVRVAGKIVAVWRPIATEKDENGKDVLDEQGMPRPKEMFTGGEAMRPMAGRPGRYEALILREPEDRRVTGKYLRRANEDVDPQTATPCVAFTFNQAGTYLFGNLTTRFKPPADDSDERPNRYRLAVLLNDELQTAPGIRTPITGGNGIITGMSIPEVRETVTVLNAGALPREIKRDPISEFTVSPTLGADVQSKGKLALVVSTVAVVAFMGFYYLIAGVVADFAMLLNLLFIVGAMALIDAAFTLPGLAGLVLSAGMAVDANVLIYERIREETERGASLRMAIHNGFEKAFTAIFDSNLTTLITSVILYWIGTDQIKGFAVSLFIGLVMNLFTAVFISRIVLEVMEKSRLVKRLHMLKWIGFTNIDFVSKQNLAIGISTVFVVIGLGAFVYRGESNYDIDFTGGTMISVQFNDAQKVDEVRAKLEQKLGSNITVEELSSTDTSKTDKLFRLRTTDQDEKKIADQVNEAFPNQLVHVSMSATGIEALPATAPEVKEGEKAADFDEAFAGGTRASLSFNQEVAVATVQSYLLAQLAELGHPNEGAFTLFGTEGSGMTAAEGQVKLFKTIGLKVAKSVPQADVEKGLKLLTEKFQTTPLFDEVTTFESSVAQETKLAAVFAVVLSLIAIVVYVWFRFENFVYGLAAVVALAHDVLVTLGAVSLASLFANNPIGDLFMLNDFKISMSMIAAFLTIVGYSLNDTIVIFDRLREIRGKNPHITKEMINLTVNQCLSRTILTALTVFLSVLILYVLGGEGIHGFAFAMTVGTLAGTYSTVYIASPLVLYFMERARLAAAKPASTSKKAAPQAT
jgi:SecD/SecF fusion protein